MKHRLGEIEDCPACQESLAGNPPWTWQQKICLGFCISGGVMALVALGYAVWIW